MMRSALLAGLATMLGITAAAQVPADSGAAMQDSALRVFFDCPGYSPGCDFDFLRTDITWVN